MVLLLCLLAFWGIYPENNILASNIDRIQEDEGICQSSNFFYSMPLSDLISFVRIYHVNLYKYTLALRRVGFSQDEIREWLARILSIYYCID